MHLNQVWVSSAEVKFQTIIHCHFPMSHHDFIQKNVKILTMPEAPEADKYIILSHLSSSLYKNNLSFTDQINFKTQ